MSDFPATHSMDTLWFAVDKDGNVAVFESGESGAVPEDAFADQYGEFEGFSEACAKIERRGVLLDIEEAREPGADEGDGGADSDYLDSAYFEDGSTAHVLVFLRSGEAARPDIDAGIARELKAVEGVAVHYPQLTEERARALRASPDYVGSKFYDPRGELVEDEEYNPFPARGFYCYDHLCENWIAGPYGRSSVPERPLKLEELPAPFRDAVGAMRFTRLSFAETRTIQPVEHTECGSWEPGWMDSEGEYHAFEGREDEFEEPEDWGEDQ
jgi:hypothetical protein